MTDGRTERGRHWSKRAAQTADRDVPVEGEEQKEWTPDEIGEHMRQTQEGESETRDTNDVLQDASELYERKNEDYADSWRLTGQTIAMWLQHEGNDVTEIPNNPEAWIAIGLYTRRLDKMIRSFMQIFNNDGEPEVDEAVTETTEDQVPYAAMQTVIAEEMNSD
jgi:hypothetical protein